MTIIHISPSYKPAFIYGGTTVSISKLCEGLCALGHHIQVLTTTANGMVELDVSKNKISLVEGVKILYCSRLSKDPAHFSIVLLRQLYRIIKNESPIVLHIHSWWNFPSILSLLMARMFKVPTLLSPRGMLTPYSFSKSNVLLKKGFHLLIGKRLLNYPHFHATSLQEQRDISATTNRKNISVIPNLIYIPRDIHSRSATTGSSDCFHLLFLSRIDEKKGLELLFHAVKNLPFRWQLSIAGTGSMKYTTQLQQLADRLKINASLNWIGQVDHSKKYQYLAGHDLLVLPSHNENFGNVVLESLLSGTPVLVSEEVGLSEYIKETKLGWVTPLNQKSLVHNLTEAWQQADKRHHIKHTAPWRVQKDFNEMQLIHQYIQLYKELV